MNFDSFFVFFGHVNSAGTCMGTNKGDVRQTYAVTTVAQEFFKTAAMDPYAPNVPVFVNDVDHTTFLVDDHAEFNIAYYSHVSSSQTSTWSHATVVTGINDILFAWLTKQPGVLSKVPQIMSCIPISAAGAPQVHVRVSVLTSLSAVTHTTNAIYFNTATTTSAAPASRTPVILSSTKAVSIVIPSPSKADVSPGQPSSHPTQPTASQEAGTSVAIPSDQSDNQPIKNSVGGAPSNKPLSPITSGATNESPQVPAQPTVTQSAIAPPAAPSEKSLDNPTQQPAKSDVSISAPFNGPGNQPTQSNTNVAGVSSAFLSHGSVSGAELGTQVTQTNEPDVVVFGGINATVLSPSSFPVQSPTLNTRGHVVQTSETAVAFQGQTIANGQTLHDSAVTLPTKPAAPVEGSSFVPVSSEAYVIAGQTLNPGGSAIEISGTTYSLQATGGVIVNGETVPVSTVAPLASPPTAPVVIGEITATPLASGLYIVADQTLSRGGSAIEVYGTTYSLPPSASNAVVNGQAAPISIIQPTLQPPATVVIGGVTAKPESSGAYYLIAGQTLNPGGSALEVSGVTYSLPSSGANIVINGATSNIAQTDIRTVSAVVFGSITAVPLLAGGYVVGSQIISPGGSAVEISGTVYSLPTSGNSVVVDGTTTAIQAITTDDALITLGSQTYTAVAASAIPLVIASQTLVPGGNAITVSGTVFSLPSDATGSIVINGQTTALATTASGVIELSIGSQQLSFTPLSSGIVIASQTLYPGGPAITVKGETLSIPLHGTALVLQSGTATTTEGLGGYIWQGIAPSTSDSTSNARSETGHTSSIAVLSGTSSLTGNTSTQAAASTETKSASAAHTSTSGADSGQSTSSYKSATIALVVCLFAVVLW
jgi:hypothetical protein